MILTFIFLTIIILLFMISDIIDFVKYSIKNFPLTSTAIIWFILFLLTCFLFDHIIQIKNFISTYFPG
jgi:hypothetical protein